LELGKNATKIHPKKAVKRYTNRGAISKTKKKKQRGSRVLRKVKRDGIPNLQGRVHKEAKSVRSEILRISFLVGEKIRTVRLSQREPRKKEAQHVEKEEKLS